jgi:hypothetical protein
MAESFVEAEGKCALCGGAIQTLDDPPTDNSIVTCQSCGREIGTCKDIHDKIGQAALNEAIAVRDAAIAGFQRRLKRINQKSR